MTCPTKHVRSRRAPLQRATSMILWVGRKANSHHYPKAVIKNCLKHCFGTEQFCNSC